MHKRLPAPDLGSTYLLSPDESPQLLLSWTDHLAIQDTKYVPLADLEIARVLPL